ncbi:hypothetical protein CO612_01450 [Lysobacteraceae bacterium NML71-0210]|nr:hypothetical protein CO612_01450 [Xanthomonadaceae bacterium NML71-0210]
MLTLFAWIGLVVLLGRLGYAVSAAQAAVWVLATIVALVMWPLTVRGVYRYQWNYRNHPVYEPLPPYGSTPLPEVPPIAMALPQRAMRVVLLLLGALSLFLLCGIQNVIVSVNSFLGRLSSGPSSFMALLQLVAFVLMSALLVLVLWWTERKLQGMKPDTHQYQSARLQQSWYVSAVAAWVMCLLFGQIFGAVALSKL